MTQQVRWAAAAMTMAAGTWSQAAFSTSDPGRFDSGSLTSRLEARARLDNAGGGSWKTAIWASGGSTPVAHGGNMVSNWVSGTPYQFQFDYNLSSGQATWLINGRTASAIVPLTSGRNLAGIRFEARATTGNFSAAIEQAQFAFDGGAYQAVGGLGTVIATGNQFTTGPMVYLTQNVGSISVRGTLKFEFNGTASGDQVRAAVRLFEGTESLSPGVAIPTPQTAGVVLGAVLVALRRRRC